VRPEPRTREQDGGAAPLLTRELGLFGAVLMGLGAMMFVSLGLGAGIAGPAVLLALALAAG
jgi:APA family basic amino acid/polyamine antiporter